MVLEDKLHKNLDHTTYLRIILKWGKKSKFMDKAHTNLLALDGFPPFSNTVGR